MLAFNDSISDDIGIETTKSQCSRTKRDSPLPSPPTINNKGSVAAANSPINASPSASNPITK